MKNIEKYFDELNKIVADEGYDIICSADVLMQRKGVITYYRAYDCRIIDCERCIKDKKQWLFSEATPDAPKLTQFEKQMLLNLEGNYRYIARDKNGALYVYYGLPSKDNINWKSIARSDSLKPFNELFTMVQWEDNEPALIEDLLKFEVITYED